MRVTVKCPDCDGSLPVDVASAPDEVTCGRCRQTIPLKVSEDVRTDKAVDACPLCEGHDFYFRKDFDPTLGLTVVIIGGLVSAGFYWFGLDLVAYGVLGMAALVDLLVYSRLKDLTVCYRCHAEFRGTYTAVAPIFDLATADELELEWARQVESRQRRSQKLGAS